MRRIVGSELEAEPRGVKKLLSKLREWREREDASVRRMRAGGVS